jgi:hypothetical protein
MTTKVQITMDLKQARIMMRAMDFYMRILMGQFDEFEHMFFQYEPNDPVFERYRDEKAISNVRCGLKIAKDEIYPKLDYYAYYGITQPPCPENATIVYDVFKSMDHAIAWHLNPEGGMMVSYDKPMHWYKELPLPEVKVFEE